MRKDFEVVLIEDLTSYALPYLWFYKNMYCLNPHSLLTDTINHMIVIILTLRALLVGFSFNKFEIWHKKYLNIQNIQLSLYNKVKRFNCRLTGNARRLKLWYTLGPLIMMGLRPLVKVFALSLPRDLLLLWVWDLWKAETVM